MVLGEDQIVRTILDLGFPIVAFLLMWWQSTKTIKQNTETLGELATLIRTEIRRNK